jgi:hypothetical protein
MSLDTSLRLLGGAGILGGVIFIGLANRLRVTQSPHLAIALLGIATVVVGAFVVVVEAAAPARIGVSVAVGVAGMLEVWVVVRPARTLRAGHDTPPALLQAFAAVRA